MKTRPPFAAWDTETDGLGGKLLAVSYCLEDGAPHYFTHKNPEKISAFILDRILENPNYRWYAHNAQYDWRYIIPEIRKRKMRVKYMSRDETNIYAIILNPDTDEQTFLVDSMAVWPHSLRKFADTFASDLPKLSIDVKNFDPLNPQHIAYSKRDSLTLVTCLTRFNDSILNGYGCNLNLTIASTAMQSWRMTLPKGTKYLPALRYESFLRRAYYGGLVLPLDSREYRGAKTYDINSSYPAAMRDNDYPIGDAYESFNLHPGKLGIFECIVTTPVNLKVPIIGMKTKRGKAEFTLWPRGTFKTTVTSIEIEFAKKYGYKFTIIKGVEFSKVCRPFNAFVNKSQLIRVENTATPMETVAKLIQNSLYGKFGAQRLRTRIVDAFTEPETELDGAVPIGDDLYLTKEFSDTMICLPQWAAFVTAYARVKLLTAIYAVGADNVLYADTDSLTVKSHVTVPTGHDYGEFKLEKTWATFRVIAPKVYAGRLNSGEWKGAAKGLPKSRMADAEWAAIHGGDKNLTIEYDTLPSFIQYLKGKGELKKAHRKVTNLKNSQNWELAQSGTIIPRETFYQNEFEL